MVGPTGSGKTEVSIDIAQELGAEIVSVDSMQVYRGMDIGTAKASAEQQQRVPHHMIDVVDPQDPYSVAEFQEAGRAAIRSILESGQNVLIVGGSGLHLRALIDPLEVAPTDPELRADLKVQPTEDLVRELVSADPDAGSEVDLANPRRVIRAVEVLRLTGLTPTARASTEAAQRYREYQPEIECAIVGLDPEELLPERVHRRTRNMFRDGLVSEAESLELGPTAREAVGYKQVLEAPDRSDVEALVESVARATRQLAKRQRTFFRRDPRIAWLPWSDDLAEHVDRIKRHWSEVGS